MVYKDLLLDFFGFALLIAGVTSDRLYMHTSPSNQHVEEGSPFSLDCRVASSHKIDYRWMQNGRFVSYSHRRYLDSRNNRTLIFEHADRWFDYGNYYCLGWNTALKAQSKSKQAKVNIYWLDAPVRIILKSPKEQKQIKDGVYFQLECNANAEPGLIKDNVNWYLNGKIIPSSNLDQNGSLTIKSMSTEFTGFIHCSIIHTAGKLDSVYPFIIYYKEDTKLDPKLFSLYEVKGTRVTIQCPWASESVVWYTMQRLGDPFITLRKGNLKNIEINKDKLTILSMDESSDTYYVCQSVNKDVLRDAIFKVSLATMYDFKDNRFSPPYQQNTPVVIRNNGHGLIRFYPDFSPSNNFFFDKIPNPLPNITWSFNNQDLPLAKSVIDDTQNKFVENGRHLKILRATEKDRGIYYIKMSNKAGERVRAFRVEVTFPPKFEPQNNLRQTLKEGESVVLDCGIVKMADESITRVYWKKDNFSISTYNKNIKFHKSNQQLQIVTARPIHSGRYQCFVETADYPVYSNSPIEIAVRAKLKFTDETTDVFLERGKNGKLPCKAKGHGIIEIRLYKYNPITKEKEAVNEESRELREGSLILKKVLKNVAGFYLCEAYSPDTDEKINKTIVVHVGEKPKIIRISSNITVQEGSTIYMDCEATGDPKPSYNWLVDRFSYEKGYLITYNPKSDKSNRKKVFKNGTLVIKNVLFTDEGRYSCRAVNHRSLWDEESVIVKVLMPEEYSKYKKGGKFNKGMIKTIVIVVSCAIIYLGLIVGLTAFCSVRMLRHRRNRALNDKLGENRQLMQPLSNTAANSVGHQGSNLRNGSLPPHKRTPYLPQVPLSSSSVANMSNSNPLGSSNPQHTITTSAGPLSNYYTQYSLDNNHNHPAHYIPPMSYQTQPLLVSAPPPTPLESRSNMSSTNSASMYTRSHFSSSTNGNCTTSGIGGPSSVSGPLCSLNMSSMERLTYPRHELQTETFLGKGEFGDVLLARARNIQDGESQSLVVVKSLTNPNEPSLCHEFHRQLDMLTRVDSEFVTSLLGICVEVEPYLLILEYCEWGNLKQLLKCVREQSSPNMPTVGRTQRLAFCEQIATGMEAIAAQHCVHKDLATRNVLVTPQLRVKVALISLCREGEHQMDYYQDGDRPLPLRWMSPEAVICNELSCQSDAWSYGVTTTEIFATTNSPPLSNLTHEQILDTLASSPSLMHQQVTSMYSTLVNPHQMPDMPKQLLNNILHKCLNIEPQKRPSFTEIRMELKSIIGETKV